jgi:hypothetical protein
MPFFFPEDEEAHDHIVLDSESLENLNYPIDAILETIGSELQSLRITATHVRSVPIRIYNNLTDLEIMFTNGDAEEYVGLDIIFHHATALESLTLVGFIIPDLFSFLPHSSAARLPRLGSFRLSCELTESTHIGAEEISLLSGFLQGRPLLRRLYLRIPSMSWFDTSRIIFILKNLGGLEVLGLHTGYNSLEEHELIEVLANNLSPKLHALHLAMDWGGDSLLPLVSVWVLPTFIPYPQRCLKCYLGGCSRQTTTPHVPSPLQRNRPPSHSFRRSRRRKWTANDRPQSSAMDN